jgi:universal stress protein A
MIRKILVATDLTEASTLAVHAAIDLGQRLGALVTVLHVVEPPYEARRWFAPSPTEAQFLRTIVGREKDATLRLMDEQVKAARLDRTSDAAVEIVVREGIPADDIVTAAQALGADMLVVGTHGRRGLQHLILGSVAERIVRTAPCPVLTVRARR